MDVSDEEPAAHGSASVPRVDSETGRLETVIITPPGPEFERMEPSNIERHAPDASGQLAPNPEDLLFDDLVHLPSLRAQHEVFVRALEAATGPGGVLSSRLLLAEALEIGEGHEEAIDDACRIERDAWAVSSAEVSALHDALSRLSASELAEALITGASSAAEGAPSLRWPLPNFLFARDLAAAVGDAVVLTYAAKPARLRGMALARTILRHHPRFARRPILDVRQGQRDPHEICLEGGDVQVIDEETLLVGVSERTTRRAVERLAAIVLDRGFERVLAIAMPKWRGAMHLDTLLTRIDEGHVLLYPPLIEAPERLGIGLTEITAAGTRELGRDVVVALCEVGVTVEPVFCGGDDPIAQRREQWSDGANAFALEPGVFLTYRRNVATREALERAGFPSVPVEEFLADPEAILGTGGRAAIHIDGHELVRGRGGPRCLTLPLARR